MKMQIPGRQQDFILLIQSVNMVYSRLIIYFHVATLLNMKYNT